MILVFSFSQPQNTLLSSPHSAQCVHSNLASIYLHPDVTSISECGKSQKFWIDLLSFKYNFRTCFGAKSAWSYSWSTHRYLCPLYLGIRDQTFCYDKFIKKQRFCKTTLVISYDLFQYFVVNIAGFGCFLDNF